MKTFTKNPTNNLPPSGRMILWVTLLLALCWGLTPGYAQVVANVTSPNHSRTVPVEIWTVPAGGPYKVWITARGAKGGKGVENGQNLGGAGATIAGEFLVSSGQVLELTAGAPGGSGSGEDGGGGGGGGGSAVKIQGGTLLLVAGGGGGGGQFRLGGNGGGGSSGPIGSASIGGGGAGAGGFAQDGDLTSRALKSPFG